MVGGDVSFHVKFALTSDPTPSEKCRLRPISAYNVSTIRATEKVQSSRIGSRPRAFQRAVGEVHTLPINPQRVAQKVNLSDLWIKNQFKSNKLYYKVSLCENFQLRGCSTTIPLSNGVYMLPVNVTLEPNI